MKPKPPEPLSRYQLLARLHDVLAPVEQYLEIGVQTGASLALAEGAGVAWGVDPHPVVLPEFERANQRIKAETSDEFFGCESCERPTIDFAFIDGSHLFEDALRDFVYVQRHAGPHTVVVFDDVLPYSQDIAWRHQPPGDWSGDVFKIPYILGTYQPRLHLVLADVSPCGALIVTGLDRADVTLDRQYDKIVQEFHHGHYQTEPDEVTGSTLRHWNYVPAEVLDRRNAVSGHRAVEIVRDLVERGELAKGKVRA